MFLRATIRWKDGKQHRYWSVVESRRVAGKPVVQRPLLYLGGINDSQRSAWRETITVLEDGHTEPRTLSLLIVSVNVVEKRAWRSEAVV